MQFECIFSWSFGNSLRQNRLPGYPFRLLTAFAATFPKGTAELPQSKPDGFASSLGEGASGAMAKFAPEIPPQSLRDSSPKGAPFGAAAKFPATAKAVPLGKVA